MPGSSLWLIPPANSPFTRSLNTWITATVPYRFSPLKPPAFIPHITLTSNIPYGPDDAQPFDAQVWLDCLELPLPGPDDDQIVIDLRALEAGEPFFKKLTLKIDKDNEPLERLAVACRAQGVYSGDFEKARSWVKDDYLPHLSIMYGDMPLKAAAKMMPALIQDFDRAKSVFKPKKDGTVAVGGSIVLVPTDKGIPQWKPIASREIPGMVWKYNVM